MTMKTHHMKKPVQLSLFEPVVLRDEYLLAIMSPRCAVYNLWLIREPGGYVVRKESGAAGKKTVGRVWAFDSLEKAETYFDKKVREKLNPDRKSRVYKRAAIADNKKAA